LTDAQERQILEGIPSIRIGECAALLGVSRCVVVRLANEGKLPHWRSPGGQRRFSRVLVERVAREADAQSNGGA